MVALTMTVGVDGNEGESLPSDERDVTSEWGIREGAEGDSPEAVATELDHAVRFYERDEELSQVVVAWIAAGLVRGELVTVIATEHHRRAFLEALAERDDVDVARACDDKQLLLLDAETTLAALMVDGAPEWERFRNVVGSALRRPGLPGRRTTSSRAYGEMVNLLWTRGQRGAAIHLEEMWSDLQRQLPFSLLCSYLLSGFRQAPGEIRRVCALHGPVQGPPLAALAVDAGDLGALETRVTAVEIEHQRDVERALRASLREVRRHQEIVARAESELRDFVENAPMAMHWVGPDGVIIWANRAQLNLLGYGEREYVGRPVSDFYVEPAEAEAVLARLERREELHDHEVRLLARDGSIKYVLIKSNVYWRDGKFAHTRCFTVDVSERRHAARTAVTRGDRSERLQAITAAIADAVTTEQVFEAVVDHVGAALSAATSALLLSRPEQGVAQLVRANGYSPEARAFLASTPLDTAETFPALDALRTGEPLWIARQEDIRARYPHLAPVMSPGRSYCVACLPVVAQGRTLGALAFTFDAPRGPLTDDDKDFLLLAARHSGQALERLRLFGAEQDGRLRAELLYGLARAVIGAERVELAFEAALDAMKVGLGTDRAAILVQDGAGVMQFRAWRNMSEEYRRAVEGHSPWARDARDPQPIVVADAANDPGLTAFRALFRREGIGALVFVPLVAGGRLVGKTMIYYRSRHEPSRQDLDLARAIADHVAAAISRFQSMAELQETIRFNQMFTGILGHDLRNPLAAISTSARLAMGREGSEKMLKPLSRILSSGERMARMIDQLLDFTRIRAAGGIPVNREPLDLIPILGQVMDELDDANPEWTLRLQQAGDTAGVWDADRLSQVFSNLVANAVQHGLAAGGVTVIVDGTAVDIVRIEVHNAGCISEGHLATLFEPLTGRGSGRSSRGLGLGLYITREVVRAHGGRIDVISDDERGTIFTVVLPRSVEAGAVPPAPQAVRQP